MGQTDLLRHWLSSKLLPSFRVLHGGSKAKIMQNPCFWVEILSFRRNSHWDVCLQIPYMIRRSTEITPTGNL